MKKEDLNLDCLGYIRDRERRVSVIESSRVEGRKQERKEGKKERKKGKTLPPS